MPSDAGVPLLYMKHLSAPVLWFKPMRVNVKFVGNLTSEVPRTEALVDL